MTHLIRYLDVVCGALGAVAVLAAVTLLFGWVIALLVAGVAFITFALWGPAWD